MDIYNKVFSYVVMGLGSLFMVAIEFFFHCVNFISIHLKYCLYKCSIKMYDDDINKSLILLDSAYIDSVSNELFIYKDAEYKNSEQHGFYRDIRLNFRMLSIQLRLLQAEKLTTEEVDMDRVLMLYRIRSEIIKLTYTLSNLRKLRGDLDVIQQ